MPEADTAVLNKYGRIALRNCGRINPESIDEYISRGGYSGFPIGDIIEEIKMSGLSGRGGAGFPTWFKWQAIKDSPGSDKYIIVNADEGDPGAFMDRAILEGDPHSVIEGMLLCAYAVGANDGVIYVRAEYPLAIKRLETAIKQANERGFIGKNCFGTDFPFFLRIKAGAGAFVCGEETALIASLEGERGMPRLKPPFPAQKGYFQNPTNINNVETFANVPWIIKNGGAAFAAIGTAASKGNKVFALTGKIKNGGLAEVPMGVTLRECIFGMGGGIRDGKAFKAVQLGGPSGGCIPESLLDTAVDYKALSATGAIMGSGGMVVMDESTCIVDMARFFLEFTCKESCGKCTHCRIGTKRMLEILERIVAGKGKEGDVEQLEELAAQIKDGALCGLGQTAPNPVLTSIRYFRNEFEDHIVGKKCTAGHCRALVKYYIDEKKCIGCTLCYKKCPSAAISGTLKNAHTVDNEKCIKCGECRKICKLGAVSVR
ncbi:MAG: 4Fe-4S binding protein [Defluviitaleaceae bacterium]|nr:4Fe-4S binding protein [Defluviitaleaceae bacterium]